MNIGEQIIGEIIKQGMIRVVAPDPECVHIFAWSANSNDQLDAFVAESADVQIPKRLSELYGKALALLGAPDGNNPEELLEWASRKGNQLHQTN